MSIKNDLSNFEIEILEENKEGKIKPNNFLMDILENKTFFIIITILLFIKFTPQILNNLNLAIQLLINTLNIRNSTLIRYINGFIYFIISIYIITFISGIFLKSRTLKSLIGKETTIFILLTVFFSLFIAYSSSTHNLNEDITYFVNDSQKSFTKSIEQLICIFDRNCLKTEMNSNQAQTVKNQVYSISLENPYQQDSLYKKDLSKGLDFYYNIQSSNELYLEKIECYINDEKTPISTTEINQPLNTNSEKYSYKFKCNNLDKINFNKKEISPIIKFKLYLNIDTTATQQIPIVNYEKYISENYEKTPNKYQLKIDTQKSTSDRIGFVRTNKAMKIDDNILLKSLPIITGDEKISEINFPLVIEKEQSNSFGTFVSGKITKFELPEILENNNPDNNYLNEIEFKDEKYSQQIYLKENPNINYDLITKVDTLKFTIKSNFIKKDSVRLNVIDPNFKEIKPNTIQSEDNTQTTPSEQTIN